MEAPVGSSAILPPILVPSKKWYQNKKMFLLTIPALLILMALSITIVGKPKTATTQPELSPAEQDLSLYNIDPDDDRIPSFIETKLGTDPEKSELNRCFDTKCEATDVEAIKAKPRKVMILLDSSGSMQQKVGTLTKMDAAKLAIKEYLNKAAGLPSTQVGLLVYGHKGTSAVADKLESCASAEVKVELGKLNTETAGVALADIQSAGWTPIGLALSEVAKSFVSASEDSDKPKEESINEIVIISDGVETCDTNPVAVAKALYESKDKIVVHVIGFNVGTADGRALRIISQAAGGTYATAPTIDELKLAMDLQWDNYVRRIREEACKTKGFETYLACKDEAVQRVRSYVSAELSRDPRAIPFEEKKKIERLRWIFPAYMKGTLDPQLMDALEASDSAIQSPQ